MNSHSNGSRTQAKGIGLKGLNAKAQETRNFLELF